MDTLKLLDAIFGDEKTREIVRDSETPRSYLTSEDEAKLRALRAALGLPDVE